MDQVIEVVHSIVQNVKNHADMQIIRVVVKNAFNVNVEAHHISNVQTAVKNSKSVIIKKDILKHVYAKIVQEAAKFLN